MDDVVTVDGVAPRGGDVRSLSFGALSFFFFALLFRLIHSLSSLEMLLDNQVGRYARKGRMVKYLLSLFAPFPRDATEERLPNPGMSSSLCHSIF